MEGLVYFAAGLTVGCLFTVALCLPSVGRALARVMAVLFLGSGAGALVWGIFTIIRGGTINSPFGGDWIREESEIFAWAGGLLVGGVATLVLSFVGRSEPGAGR